MIKKLCGVVLLALPIATHAEEAPFTHFDGSELSQAIAKQFVLPMIAATQPDADMSGRFSWLNLDVSGDSYGELFIRLESAGLCAETGCPIIGFMRNDRDSWDVILTAVGTEIHVDPESADTIEILGGSKPQAWTFDVDARALLPAD